MMLTVRELKCEMDGREVYRSLSTWHEYLKLMAANVITLWIKPSLNDQQKINRINFVLDMRNRRLAIDNDYSSRGTHIYSA